MDPNQANPAGMPMPPALSQPQSGGTVQFGDAPAPIPQAENGQPAPSSTTDASQGHVSAVPQMLGMTPQTANDNDMIEKEWVLKAKEIVAATAGDPYQQNRQLAALKADYMKKRYNKIVKISD